MNLHIIKPEKRNDENLEFDETLQRYKLTKACCRENFEITFPNDNILDREIKRNTNNVYDFIFQRINSNNTDFVKFVLNNTVEGRNLILQALMYQMEANLENGFNSIGKMSVVNAQNGSIGNRDELMRNQVSVETERYLLNNSTNILGINIFYSGSLPSYFWKERKI